MLDSVLEKVLKNVFRKRCRDFFLIIEQNKGKAFEKTLVMKCGVFTL